MGLSTSDTFAYQSIVECPTQCEELNCALRRSFCQPSTLGLAFEDSFNFDTSTEVSFVASFNFRGSKGRFRRSQKHAGLVDYTESCNSWAYSFVANSIRTSMRCLVSSAASAFNQVARFRSFEESKRTARS